MPNNSSSSAEATANGAEAPLTNNFIRPDSREATPNEASAAGGEPQPVQQHDETTSEAFADAEATSTRGPSKANPSEANQPLNGANAPSSQSDSTERSQPFIGIILPSGLLIEKTNTATQP